MLYVFNVFNKMTSNNVGEILVLKYFWCHNYTKECH